MMGEGYSFELVERAEQLYCVDGHTFEAVATLTGVAVSTLKRWSERYDWQDKKESIRQAMAVLQIGGSVLDALEAGIRPVEDNLADHWVGTSGMPSITSIVSHSTIGTVISG
mgnify:CR=1 FL=1